MPVHYRLKRRAERSCLFVAVLALGLSLLSIAAQAQDGFVVDRVVAVVGDDIVLRSDVDAFVFNYLQQQQARAQVQYSEELWHQALDELINQKVLLVHARRDTTIEVSDEQVEETLDDRLNRIASQVGGMEQLEEVYGRSMVQVRAEFREEIRDQLVAQQFQQRKIQRIRITPTEVRKWFAQFPADSLPEVPETVRLAHIVKYPEIDPAAREEARQMASAIRDSILAGASIEELARRYSDDPGSVNQGGRYDGINISELVPEFGAVASTLEPESVSQVFESRFGFHVMRLNSRIGDRIDFNHVLIRVDDSRTLPGDALEELAIIRDSVLVNRMPFELMAKRHSEEEQTANRGGYIVDPRTGERDIPMAALRPSWRRTIDGLQPGEISEPAETEMLDGNRALHIVMLQRRIPAHRMSLEKDYAYIEQLALQDKRARELQEWLKRLRTDVYVNVLVETPALTTARAN